MKTNDVQTEDVQTTRIREEKRENNNEKKSKKTLRWIKLSE